MAVAVSHAKTIASWIATKLRTGVTPALNFVHLGDLSYLPLPPGWVSSHVPCLFIRPTRTHWDKTTLGPNAKWTETISFRIAHYFKYGDGEDIWTTKFDHANVVADLLMFNFLLSGITGMTNGAILDTSLDDIEWEGSAEDDLAAQSGSALTANVFLYSVKVQGLRNQ